MIAFILACYGVLVYQLYVWQVRDAESYRAEAVTQQLKDTTLPAVRGSIYSANGKLLAKSSTVWNIVADPSSILKSGATEAQIQTAAEHIAELLDDGTTADTVYKALTASNKDTGEPYQYRVVKKSVEKPVADAILAYADSYRLKDGAAVDTSLQTEEKEDKKDGEAKTSKATRILYLTSEQAASRTYPYGEFLASVLGFCNEDGSGAYGLEKYYDETLAGTPGRSVAETDAYGEPLASGQADVHEAIDGSNLNLTIDENVQSIVEEYLTEAMSTFTVHGRGSAIVMNVKTGAILAMASLEQFDPNDPKTITDPKMNEILAKTEIDAEDIDWNIVADPSSILKSGATEAQIQTAAEHIAELLDDGTTADTVYKALTASNKDTGEPYQYRVVKKSVEKPVADAILAYADSYRLKDGAAVDTSLQTEEKEDKKDGEAKTSKATRILYLTSEQAASRTYPYGEFLASVLGFCNEDGSGAYGLEKYYDETLAGTPGRSVAETDAYGEPLASGQADVHEAIDGSNLNLTIDENVQSIVEEYLTEAMSTFTVHGRGSAIVMNVKTGAILAMASLEQFDPNDPKTITDPKMNEILAKTEIDAEDIDWLESRLGEKAVKDIIADGIISHEKTTNEKGEEVSSEATQLQGMMREAQWKNKNITELYMPGSVFKLITASAGLESGVMSAEQTFYCGGSLTVNEGSELWEHTYRCANGEVHYEQDMAGALNHSCNLWFIQAAETLKPQIFYDYIQAFGFTQPTGIDLPNETRWTSVYNAEQMAEVDTNLYTAAFGQNESITPMQMATAVAAIANGGYLVTPYVVDSISDKDGNIISQTETNIRRQVISEEVSRQLLAMMENNVHGAGDYHSCANAYVAGYRIGGKSGTAERTDRHLRGDGDYYKMMSFAAVLPIDDPEIEVFVLLDDPRWVKDYASQVVAPVVGNIISEIAPYLGIEQDADYNPTGTVTVQTCLDYTWTNAQVTLNRLGLKHKLIGPSSGNIVYQYPVGGSVVPAGSTIYLYTATDQNSMTTTPDVVGKTGTFAEQMLKAANLNVQFAGDSSGKVVAQDVEAGTSAAYGTIITLTMDSGEDTTNDAPTVTEEIDPANEEG